MKKKAYIVAAFYNYSYDVRIRYLVPCIEKLGFEVKILTSNFNHRNKSKYHINDPQAILIDVPSYVRNLSIRRIISHYIFAKMAFSIIQKDQPDLIYAITPPNFLFYFMGKYRRRSNSLLVFDIDDLWPETLPLSGYPQKIAQPFLAVWSRIRNNSLKYADGTICECDLFNSVVSKYCRKDSVYTIYMCKNNYEIDLLLSDIDVSELQFVYLGAINNIIDISFIISFLREVRKDRAIKLHIIGDGENRDDFLLQCKDAGIPFIFHGEIYDNFEKMQILRRCHFAFNIFKTTVMIGVTMKSLEYFHWGLVLINNIGCDSDIIVNNEKCGFNVSQKNYMEIVKAIEGLSKEELYQMKKNSRSVFLKYFDDSVVIGQYEKYFNKLINESR